MTGFFRWLRGWAEPAVAALLLLATGGCVTGPHIEPPPTTISDEQAYREFYPTYAEICAVSELEKRPGFGADLFSGIGGHAVLYLNGVCRRDDEPYPVLVMCDENKHPADGVGISSNEHYKNAEWVATEGREFFFNGGLAPGQPVTKDVYRATQAEAQTKGIFTDITFHKRFYDDMGTAFTPASYRYEISIATDYAITFGRNRYCARTPLDRAQMTSVIQYLNQENAPYRAGKSFEWDLFENNCGHLNHNALAAADLWDIWPTNRPIFISIFDFPVPKNEFVNMMRRTNDEPIDDLASLYDDEAARRMLLEHGRLPTEPGGLMDWGSIPQENQVYDPKSEIIFLDEPITGSYQKNFRAILTEPRYFRLRDNLAYFQALYARIEANRRPVEAYLKDRSPEDQAAFRQFYAAYFAYIDHSSAEVARNLAALKT